MRGRTCRAFSRRTAAATTACFAALLFFTPQTRGEAWLDAGDSGLRSDIQYLVDTGAIEIMLTGWPIPSADVAWAIEGIKKPEDLSSGQLAALNRVKTHLGVFRSDALRITAYTAVAGNPIVLRTFDDTPRENVEIGGTLSDSGERFAGRLAVQWVHDPADGQSFRLDGTYGSMRLGNWLLTAGALDRWWGPGWDGSLILSSNARPVPAIALDRESSKAFESPWLSWIGPWRLSTFMGRMEEHRQDIDHPLLYGMRISFRPFGNIHFGSVHPLRGFEFSVERTAQWCGEGLPCNFDAFWNMLRGHDNEGENVKPEDEPGNQLAGWSLRWASPWKSLPIAWYRQKTGETIDEHSPLPRRTLDIYGAETWGSTASGVGWRVHAEYADTACSHREGETEPFWDCAYDSALFDVEGYRYRGHPLGHSIDGDGLSYTLGMQVTTPSRRSAWLLLRYAELNRGGVVPDTRNTVAQEPTDDWGFEFGAAVPSGRSDLKLGLGFDHATDQITQDVSQTVHGFLQYTYRF